MNRSLLIAALVSVLLHAGVAVGGRLFTKKPGPAPLAEEMPVIELTLPPPPEPEEPEIVENVVSESPAESVGLVPPMQADLPTATLDATFVQRAQPVPPPSISRPAGMGNILPSAPPRASVGGGLKNIFNLADLDKQIEVRVRPPPVYPFEMRRSGLRGEVVVEFIVDTRGNVRDPVIISSTHAGFEQAALDAVMRWKFMPGQKGGVAVNTRVRQRFPFTLEGN
jgi:TonB family C-terminal domain